MDQSELSELHEIQTNEIEALKAIFMDDFTEVEEKKTAWNVRWAINWYVIVMFK